MTTYQIQKYLVDNFNLRIEQSGINPPYSCVVCSNKIPTQLFSKAYKYDDNSICVGSFETGKPHVPLINYFKIDKIELVIKDREKDNLLRDCYPFLVHALCSIPDEVPEYKKATELIERFKALGLDF